MISYVSTHLGWWGAGACTLFATHFTCLAELAAIYPNCKLWHFGVNAIPQSEQLGYTWKLKPGQQQAVHYGLILANSVGIPQQVNDALLSETPSLNMRRRTEQICLEGKECHRMHLAYAGEHFCCYC